MGMYGNRDMKVVVKKDELMAILVKNREAHCAEFKVACEGYQKAAVAELTQRLAAFEKVDPQNNNLSLDFSKLPKPQSHEQDYDRAIGLLKLHAEEKLTLDTDAYERFVEDNWEWKTGFAHTNSMYGNR